MDTPMTRSKARMPRQFQESRRACLLGPALGFSGHFCSIRRRVLGWSEIQFQQRHAEWHELPVEFTSVNVRLLDLYANAAGLVAGIHRFRIGTEAEIFEN